MAGKTTYTQYYSDFIGLDASSDPRAVSRNRLAYAVNMWRDYESEQGAAIETFPGFRRVAKSLGIDVVDGSESGQIGAVHGLYHFRSRKGVDYIVVHAGTKIYAFEDEALASGNYENIANRSAVIAEGVADNDSTGFIYNNNLYILDGSHYLTVTTVDGETSEIKASAVDAYIPTTYYNGNLYEQRNMLTNSVGQIETKSGEYVEPLRTEVYYGCRFHSDFDGSVFFWEISDSDVVSESISGVNSKSLKAYYAHRGNATPGYTAVLYILPNAFKDCEHLEYIFLDLGGLSVQISTDAFIGCNRLKAIYIDNTGPSGTARIEGKENIPQGVELIIDGDPEVLIKSDVFTDSGFAIRYPIFEMASAVNKVTADDEDVPYYLIELEDVEINGEEKTVVKYIYFRPEDITNEPDFTNETKSEKSLNIELNLYPTHFQTIENLKNFQDGNTDYKGTSVDALNGCTKSAVFDGRVFLTGNPELPNTVFYSHRNLTGANDPAYFGVYNYFNDGEGNTPNVDILSTPSMLMVLKGNTVQDGSVYYHVGADNTDEETMDMLPRIYPSTQGAAGLGSAGNTTPSRLSCNFYDDPVFLSKRGLEAVGKETVNLERTIQHRSSNIDRLLIREDLSKASMAEWKRYLVICCNGHIYLADSRYMVQHTDGSYQYEWYYLEGVGTYEIYADKWNYVTEYYPYIYADDLEPLPLDDYIIVGGGRLGDEVLLHKSGELDEESSVINAKAYHPDNDGYIIDVFYVIENDVKYLVSADAEQKVGKGSFFGATKIITVGDRLIFGTDNGDICIVNTDRRGMPVGERIVEYDRIDRTYYTFNGVPYLSGCSVRLDDCDKKSTTKNTVPGTTSARFKMMPGSYCTVMLSLDGRNWEKLGEAYSSRFDFTDLEFSNMSFAENENNVVIFPEISRGWINKQYYFYSDRYQAPFGLYELSYLYYVSGKIRY